MTADRAAKARAAWDQLNERQQAYLVTLYVLDQAEEEWQRGAFARGGRIRPAAEWRWIAYGYVNVGPLAPRGRMQEALDKSERRDQGAGATLAALADRKLIEQRHDELPENFHLMPWYRTDTYHVSVKLTTAGRAAARASGVDDTKPARAPRGLLSEWLWGVLVQVRSAGETGVPDHRRYTAWGYLTDRTGGALVERSGGTYVLTDVGRGHYREHWATYARLYPQVAAPHPDGADTWPAGVDTRLRTLAAAAGVLVGHLADVTREHATLTSPPAEQPTRAASGARTPELAAGLALLRVRGEQSDEHRRQRVALVGEHVPQLRQLCRAAAARYAGVAVAVVQAVVDGTDPLVALDAEAVPLDATSGRPTALDCPVTGLTGVDADIATRHRTARSGPPPKRPTRRRRARAATTSEWQPADEPAYDLVLYASYLANLVRDGQLRRLRLRAPADRAEPTTDGGA